MKRATTLKVLAGTLVLTLVASAFPLAQVALEAAREREVEAQEAVKRDGTAVAPGLADLPFPASGEGIVVAPPSSSEGTPAGADGTSSRPSADGLASPVRADASGSVLLSQVLGAAKMMGHDVAVPPLPVDKIASSQPLRAAILAWIAATGSEVEPATLARELTRADALPVPLQRDLALLLLSAIEANALQSAALARLTPEEILGIYTHPEHAADLARNVVTPHSRALTLAATQVDMKKSIEATLLLLAAVEATRGTLSAPAAQDAVETLTADVHTKTASMISLLVQAEHRVRDADKVRLAAELVALGAGIDVPPPAAAVSFEAALDALLAETAQVPAPAARLDVLARAAALPDDLEGALARLLAAQALAVRAANPEATGAPSQAAALANVLVASAEVLPTLEKYHLYWSDAPLALRMGEWTPGARIGWAAHHAGLVASTKGTGVDLARAGAILHGQPIPAAPSVPERSFMDAYAALAQIGGYAVSATARDAVLDASSRLDPAVRDAAAVLMSGAAESARLHALAFAGLTREERAFLEFETFGLDALYAKPKLTDEETRTLARASTLAARVDADALTQAGLVGLAAAEQARRLLEGRDAYGVQGSAVPVETGMRALLKRLIPFGSARAQGCAVLPSTELVDFGCDDGVILRLYYPLADVFQKTPGEMASSRAISFRDVQGPPPADNVRVGSPLPPSSAYRNGTTGRWMCTDAECVVDSMTFPPGDDHPEDSKEIAYIGEATSVLLVVSDTASTTHAPMFTTRHVCNRIDDDNGTPSPLDDLTYPGTRCRDERVARYGAPTVSLDLGGADTWLIPVGMVHVNATVPVSLHLEMGGADVYADPTPQYDGLSPLLTRLGSRQGHPTLGSAPFSGVAVAIDAGGSDVYQAASMSQGYGRFGLGALLDLGTEPDVYQGQRLVQGAASDTFTLGVGILHDRAGDDSYTAEAGQGYGLGSIFLDAGGRDGYTNDHDAWGAPAANLRIVPGGELTTFNVRDDNRIWIDGPGSLSAGLAVDIEIILSQGSSDADGFPDFVEYIVGTNPHSDAESPLTRPTIRLDSFLLDTDKDGYPDYIERALSTDPANPTDYPAGLPAGVGIVVPPPVYAILDQQGLDETLGIQGGVLRPFETAGDQGLGLTGQDKIVDLRLPLQDAGTVDYACTGSTHQNVTFPLEPLGFPLRLPIVFGAGTDPESGGPVKRQDGSAIEHCLFVSYDPDAPGQGNATAGGSSLSEKNGEFNFRLPAGILAIGDVVATTYLEDYFLVVDLGGEDRFENSAGGALPVNTTSRRTPPERNLNNQFLAPSLVLNVDLNAATAGLVEGVRGDDVYVNATRDYAQGAGFGVLLDNAGNDLYEARDGSQGAIGGVLLDLAGTDVYKARDLSQGAGLAARPLPPDQSPQTPDLPEGGNATSDNLGDQITGGYRRAFPGLLLDLGEHGPGQTFAARSHSQGFGRGYPNPTPSSQNSPVTEGILFSQDGPDLYTVGAGARYMQGVGGLDGVGLLLDRSGSDTYAAQGRFSHGATLSQTVGTNDTGPSRDQQPHPALGILVDLGGGDTYRFPSVRTQEREQKTTITRAESATTSGGTGGDHVQARRIYSDVGLHIDTTLDPANPMAFLAGLGGTGTTTIQDDNAGFIVHLPTARLAIGDNESTTYTKEYAFVVDLGGDNRYEYNAAGFIPDYVARTGKASSLADQQTPSISLFPATFLLDAGAGDSTYVSKKGLSQGAGFFSVGVLADLGGRDRFEALPDPLPSYGSTWVTVPPIIDATIGADWNGVPARPITLVSHRDERFTSDWKLRVANDDRTLFVALEGRTTSDNESERRADTLIVDLDMGRGTVPWNFTTQRTGIDEVFFRYVDGKCSPVDRGFLQNGNVAEDPPLLVDGVPPAFSGACRFMEDGRVVYEFRKDLLITENPSSPLDLGYCKTGRGFGAVVPTPTGERCAANQELGLYLEFADRGAGFTETGAPGAFYGWPAGAYRADGGFNGTSHNGNLTDEMDLWAAIGLAYEKDGVAPPATRSPSISQAAGLAGVGVVAMLGSAFSESSFLAADRALGYAGFGGLAVFFDNGGSDHYTGTERTLGAADVSGVALFLESSGNDNYLTGANSTGWTGAGGVGLFFDLGGDDEYTLRVTSIPQLDPLRDASAVTGDSTGTTPAGNNAFWQQGGSAFGADYQFQDAVGLRASGALATSLYGGTRTELAITHWDDKDKSAFPNGCTLREADRLPASEKFVASGKVCFVAQIDTGRGALNQTANEQYNTARGASPNAETRATLNNTQAQTAEVTSDATLAGTVDVQAVDFMLDRARVATATQVSHTINNARSVWSAPVDLARFDDGVFRVKAVPVFTANFTDANGERGLLVFSDDVGNANFDSSARKTLLVNNPADIGIRLAPAYDGNASATFSPFGYGAAQNLEVNWTVSRDAGEERLAREQGWQIQNHRRNVPCAPAPASVDPPLCHLLAFYLDEDGDEMETTPAAATTPSPGNIETEQIGSITPYSSRTPLLTTPLTVLNDDGVHVALPTRVAIAPTSYKTQIRAWLNHPSLGNVVDPSGNLWFLADGVLEARPNPLVMSDLAPLFGQFGDTIEQAGQTINTALEGAVEGNILWTALNITEDTTCLGTANVLGNETCANTIRGNPGVGQDIRPCTKKPPLSGPGANVPGYLAWYAVATVDERRVIRPEPVFRSGTTQVPPQSVLDLIPEQSFEEFVPVRERGCKPAVERLDEVGAAGPGGVLGELIDLDQIGGIDLSPDPAKDVPFKSMRLDLNSAPVSALWAQRGVLVDSGRVVIPPGVRIVFTIGLTASEEPLVNGDIFRDAGQDASNTLRANNVPVCVDGPTPETDFCTHVLPRKGDLPVIRLPTGGQLTALNQADFEETVTTQTIIATFNNLGESEHRTALGGLVPIASFFSTRNGPTPDDQARIELKIPAEPTTKVGIALANAITGEELRNLRSQEPAMGDVEGSPVRSGADQRRWTQYITTYSDTELADGLYHVNVTADDDVWRVSRLDSVLVDGTPPVSIVTTGKFAGKALLGAGNTLPVRWDVSEFGSGLANVTVFTRAGEATDGEDLRNMSKWTRETFRPDVRAKLVDAKGTIHLLLTVAVDKAGNVEGTRNEPDLETAIQKAFLAKIDAGADVTNGYRRVFVDTGDPRFSATGIEGGRALNFEGSDFVFTRSGSKVGFSICARDNESNVGQVILALDHIDPETGNLSTATFRAVEKGPCGVDSKLFVNDTWHIENANASKYPEGVWAALFEVYDLAGNRISVPVGNLILDHASPQVRVEPPVLPPGQTAVKPGDLVKIRLVAQDSFGVDEALTSVDASNFSVGAGALKTRPVRVNGAIFQEAQFTVDRTDLKAGSYNVVVKVPDLAGNVTRIVVPIAVNARAFEFDDGSVRVVEVSHNRVVLAWTTDEPTSAFVKYGTTTLALNSRTPIEPNATKTHTVAIEGLQPSTRYFLRAVSGSTGGFARESELVEATTRSALTLTPLAPLDNDRVSGNVKVRFEGGLLDSDDFVSYTLEVREGSTKPWSFVTTATRQGATHELSWNSTRFLDGSAYELRLTATAGKDARNVTIGPITSDNTPPAVTILSPLLATNDTTPRIVAETADALSGLGTTPATLLVDGVAVGDLVIDALPGGRLRLTHDVEVPLAPGIRTLELRVADLAGNVARETWKVAIDGEAPRLVVEPTRFAPGTTAARTGGTVTLNLTLTDLSGIAHAVADTSALSASTPETRLVRIVGTDNWQGTFSVTASEALAQKAVVVRAVDLAGNTGQTSIEITLDNIAPTVGATSLAAIGHTRAVIDVPADEPILVTGTATAPLSPPDTASTTVASRKAQLTFQGLLPSRTYAYELQVTDGAGNEVPLRGSFATERDVVPPTPVGPLSVLDLLNGTLRLSWSAATDDVGIAFYRVYRSDDNVTFRAIAEVQGTEHQDAGLPYEKAYLYKVAAVDHGANEGGASPPLRAAATAVPRIADGAVSPTLGTAATTFRYTVTYTSPGGVAPAYVRVILDGVPQNMTLASGDAKTGAVYVYETRLAPHKRDAPHTYAFEASDGRYAVRFPGDGSELRGPLVSGDALGGGDAGAFASFAQRVPLGGVAGVAIALFAAVAVAALVTRRRKEGSK